MSHYFITGIGTGVGKTFCSAALLHQHPHYAAIKPVLSGYEHVEQSDAGELLKAMGEPIHETHAEAISPWRFKAPLSPHIAAALEDKVIDKECLISFCYKKIYQHDNLLIEGVGGMMVPITSDWLVRDWMQALKLPVILVTGSYLGAINHTLLSIEALKMTNLRLHAVIISQSEDCVGLEETAASIATFLPASTILETLPRQSSFKDAPALLASQL